MNRILSLMAVLLFSLIITSATANDDSYDPATGRLTIPEITVDGITYRKVVVTIGSIISIGSQSNVIDDPSKDRVCVWNTDEDGRGVGYELTVRPSKGFIDVKMLGLTNLSTFYPTTIMLVQGTRVTNVTPLTISPGVIWVGDAAFTSGGIPTGVVKTGWLSRFPVWFNLTERFTFIVSGEAYEC